jgi:hypothetical protein
VQGWRATRLGALRAGSIRRRPDLVVLVLLVAAGVGLRVWLTIGWRPGFLGYSDSGAYLLNAAGPFFADTLRPVGYPLFLAGARGISSDLMVTILLQHALGVASGVFAYAAGRHLGLRPWPALLPAAVLLLHGPTIWLEHAVLTEGLFSFLVITGTLLTALAVQDRPSLRAGVALAGASGLALGAAGAVRTASIVLLPVFAVWVAWAFPARVTQRLAAGAALALAGFALLGANLLWAHSETGAYAFARHSYYQPYGRVGPFADCTKFTPPRGTERLCPDIPRSERLGPGYWVFSPESPISRAYGPVDHEDQPPEAASQTAAFYRKAILAQPGDYLGTVGRDLVRIVDPDFPFNPNPGVANGGDGLTPADYQLTLPAGNDWSRANEGANLNLVAQSYSNKRIARGNLRGQRSYERATRLTGAPIAILLLLALAGPIATRGRERRSAVLLTALAFTLAAAPLFLQGYNWRYVAVALGPMSAAAAFGGQGVTDRVRQARAATRAGEPAPQAA